jgi:hypothetical protein
MSCFREGTRGKHIVETPAFLGCVIKKKNARGSKLVRRIRFGNFLGWLNDFEGAAQGEWRL